ncbi:MAG: N-acetylmuramoyl-L-alanine amidase [Elusimicrobiales bacterium]|nr:N-acetylmuramoyl-L-alanine amidase [Elusimicrobiales bacterium]
MKKLIAFFLLAALPAAASAGYTVVFQPSHQTDTGEDYNEAATCGAIVDYAMARHGDKDDHKVWSYGRKDVHHADQGSNTMLAHTTAIEDGKISGYAWELRESNRLKPEIFIGVHNNGGTNRHAVWGYIHDGDANMERNRRLSNILIEEIARATDLENRGTHLDSSTGRNDYRCAATGRLGFYSIDENVNTAPYRVILEIGDSEKSRALLVSEEGRKAIGEAISRGLSRFIRGLVVERVRGK